MTTMRTPRFTLRQASPHDAAALAALRRALFQDLGQAPAPDGWTAFEGVSAGSFKTGLEQGWCLAWLAEADGAAIGSAALLFFPRLPSPQSRAVVEGYLLSVYTLPPWRGRGIATALVTAAVAKGRELGLARVRLHATAVGRPVYAAAGFGPRDDEMELVLPSA
jgi:GNAT superfamily N-acetyltransferase